MKQTSNGSADVNELNSTPITTTTTKVAPKDPEPKQTSPQAKPNIESPQSSVPYAKALYDFCMNPMEDEGCLKFQKGMIIQVSRRVDQNWAEGKLGEAVGIFPLSFVNMNQAASTLMHSYATKWRLPASIPSNDQTASTSTSPQRQILLQPTPAHPGIIRPKSPPPVTSALPAVSLAQISHDKTGLYIALHNYTPQKQDELELKKGSHYMVKETCQDGWLKGSCSDNLFKKGVFPGNYVMPLVYHQKMLAMQRNAALQAQKNQSASNTQHMRTTGAYTNLALSSIPPELPQRNIIVATQAPQQPRTAQSPLTQQNKSSENSPSAQSTQKTDDIVNKQRKESMTEMLMKKLGYNRKSNDSSAYSMDNPVFEDTSAAAASSAKVGKPNPLQFNHMRSGSCPSRFVCPPDFSNANGNIENLQYGSQRVKIRERTALPM